MVFARDFTFETQTVSVNETKPTIAQHGSTLLPPARPCVGLRSPRDCQTKKRAREALLGRVELWSHDDDPRVANFDHNWSVSVRYSMGVTCKAGIALSGKYGG